MILKHCPECGKKNEAGGKFCVDCGASLVMEDVTGGGAVSAEPGVDASFKDDVPSADSEVRQPLPCYNVTVRGFKGQGVTVDKASPYWIDDTAEVKFKLAEGEHLFEFEQKGFLYSKDKVRMLVNVRQDLIYSLSKCNLFRGMEVRDVTYTKFAPTYNLVYWGLYCLILAFLCCYYIVGNVSMNEEMEAVFGFATLLSFVWMVLSGWSLRKTRDEFLNGRYLARGFLGYWIYLNLIGAVILILSVLFGV